MSKASKSRCAAAFSFVDLVNQGIADFLSCLGREDRGSRIPPKRNDHRHCLFSTSAVWLGFDDIFQLHQHQSCFPRASLILLLLRRLQQSLLHFCVASLQLRDRPNDDSENYVYYQKFIWTLTVKDICVCTMYVNTLFENRQIKKRELLELRLLLL